jgi:hypothetical protein
MWLMLTRFLLDTRFTLYHTTLHYYWHDEKIKEFHVKAMWIPLLNRCREMIFRF